MNTIFDSSPTGFTQPLLLLTLAALVALLLLGARNAHLARIAIRNVPRRKLRTANRRKYKWPASETTRDPMGLYLAAVLGTEPRPPVALEQRSEVLAYEALNLIDGKRTVGEIRDLISGRYAPVPLAEVTEWIDLLARAGVVRLRAR